MIEYLRRLAGALILVSCSFDLNKYRRNKTSITYPRQHDYHATGDVDLYQVINRLSVEVKFHF